MSMNSTRSCTGLVVPTRIIAWMLIVLLVPAPGMAWRPAAVGSSRLQRTAAANQTYQVFLLYAIDLPVAAAGAADGPRRAEAGGAAWLTELTGATAEEVRAAVESADEPLLLAEGPGATDRPRDDVGTDAPSDLFTPPPASAPASPPIGVPSSSSERQRLADVRERLSASGDPGDRKLLEELEEAFAGSDPMRAAFRLADAEEMLGLDANRFNEASAPREDILAEIAEMDAAERARSRASAGGAASSTSPTGVPAAGPQAPAGSSAPGSSGDAQAEYQRAVAEYERRRLQDLEERTHRVTTERAVRIPGTMYGQLQQVPLDRADVNVMSLVGVRDKYVGQLDRFAADLEALLTEPGRLEAAVGQMRGAASLADDAYTNMVAAERDLAGMRTLSGSSPAGVHENLMKQARALELKGDIQGAERVRQRARENPYGWYLTRRQQFFDVLDRHPLLGLGERNPVGPDDFLFKTLHRSRANANHVALSRPYIERALREARTERARAAGINDTKGLIEFGGPKYERVREALAGEGRLQGSELNAKLAETAVGAYEQVHGATEVHDVVVGWANFGLNVVAFGAWFIPGIGPLLGATASAIMVVRDGNALRIAVLDADQVRSMGQVTGHVHVISAEDRVNAATGQFVLAVAGAALDGVAVVSVTKGPPPGIAAAPPTSPPAWWRADGAAAAGTAPRSVAAAGAQGGTSVVPPRALEIGPTGTQIAQRPPGAAAGPTGTQVASRPTEAPAGPTGTQVAERPAATGPTGTQVAARPSSGGAASPPAAQTLEGTYNEVRALAFADDGLTDEALLAAIAQVMRKGGTEAEVIAGLRQLIDSKHAATAAYFEAAGRFQAEALEAAIADARRAGVPEEEIAWVLAIRRTDASAANALKRRQLTLEGYELNNIPRDEQNALRTAYVRGQQGALTPEDIEHLRGRLEADPGYFERLPHRGWYDPQDGFEAVLSTEAAAELKAAYEHAVAAAARGGSAGPAVPPAPRSSSAVETPGGARLIDRSTPTGYRVVDSTNDYLHATGAVDADGNLIVSLRTRLETGERSTVLRGGEQFRRILEHFEGRYTGIRGSWYFEDNLAGFNAAVGKGLTPEAAALETWTGQRAIEAGYSQARILETEMAAGQYTRVEVLFTRPESAGAVVPQPTAPGSAARPSTAAGPAKTPAGAASDAVVIPDRSDTQVFLGPPGGIRPPEPPPRAAIPDDIAPSDMPTTIIPSGSDTQVLRTPPGGIRPPEPPPAAPPAAGTGTTARQAAGAASDAVVIPDRSDTQVFLGPPGGIRPPEPPPRAAIPDDIAPSDMPTTIIPSGSDTQVLRTPPGGIRPPEPPPAAPPAAGVTSAARLQAAADLVQRHLRGEPTASLRTRLNEAMRTLGGTRAEWIRALGREFDRTSALSPAALPMIALSAAGASAAGALDVAFTSLGLSSGSSFRLDAVNRGDTGVQLRDRALVVEPVAAHTPDAVPVATGVPGTVTETVEGFCLERLKPVPAEGVQYRVASPAQQARFKPLADVLDVAAEVRNRLRPDSDETGYFNFIRQWAIWTQMERLDQRRFTQAFLDQARKSVEERGGRWSSDVEKAVRAAAPNRWNDIQKVLEEANTTRASAPRARAVDHLQGAGPLAVTRLRRTGVRRARAAA